jgi:glyoxylase-like metal-dependent hydrolase (beta-lactamase superfamily II)/ferredoxin
MARIAFGRRMNLVLSVQGLSKLANRAAAYSDNVPGDWFVDERCIDCDVCRQLATATFGAAEDHSFVSRQPASPEEQHDALRALLSCPTGAIGSADLTDLAVVRAGFPEPIADDVFYNGFTSERSFGSHSYFIRHPNGNWLVESPRYLEPLAKQFADLGGIAYIFLSHRDDVADAAKYAARFGARRVIHRRDLAAQPDAEIVIDGLDDQRLGDEFTVIPTPGHTAGHCVLHYRQFLFTGDHLWSDRDDQRLGASREYNWWSWDEQIRSLARLLPLEFEWILPGHGERVHLPQVAMQEKLRELVERVS